VNAQSQANPDFVSHNYQLQLTIKNKLQLKGKGRLDKLSSTYHFIPSTTPHQQILENNFFSSPQADTIINSKHKFIWNSLHPNITLGYRSILATTFSQYPIKPSNILSKNLPDSLKRYVVHNHIVQVNEAIKEQVDLIIGTEKEPFIIAFKLGEWINANIRYIKSGIEKPYAATSTFASRIGDCDEISILYLAMLRHVGIPARYVSGVASNNNNFMFHAWIEAYFEGTNWVPFDATFRQYGYTDQGHIKLNHGFSSNNILSSYCEFFPHFGNITVHSLAPELNVKVLKSEVHKINPISIKIDAKHHVVSENSYLPLVITTRNTSPYFISTSINIHPIEDVIILGKTEKCIFYSPNEEKQFKLLLKLDKTKKENAPYNARFKENPLYKARIIISEQFGAKKDLELVFRRYAKRLTKEKAQKILERY
jgi:transglutaminase-like putative cysteine protease